MGHAAMHENDLRADNGSANSHRSGLATTRLGMIAAFFLSCLRSFRNFLRIPRMHSAFVF
jgi:hypothetical protein